jgi:hypothetical protein
LLIPAIAYKKPEIAMLRRFSRQDKRRGDYNTECL